MGIQNHNLLKDDKGSLAEIHIESLKLIVETLSNIIRGHYLGNYSINSKEDVVNEWSKIFGLRSCSL